MISELVQRWRTLPPLVQWLLSACGFLLVTLLLSWTIDAPFPVVLIVVMLISLLLSIWWKVPIWHASKQKGNEELGVKDLFEIENSTRATIGQMLTAAVALIGLVFLWREINSTNESLRLQEQAQITERFTQATNQLESDNGATRLGGIFALEQLAHDPRDPNQHWAVMQVLTAFVRERAPWPPVSASTTPRPPVSAAEVEAVIAVLGRRDTDRDPDGQVLDLRGSDLRGVAFEVEARFQSADFRGANLAGARLNYVHLERANFRSDERVLTVLDGADLNYAYLDGAFLEGAHLNGATLVDADLLEARLEDSYLQCTTPVDTEQKCATLHDADLTGAILSGAHLEGAVLTDVDLPGAELTGTHLEGANLEGAEGLTQDQLSLACVDEETTFSDPALRGWGRNCQSQQGVGATPVAVLGTERIEATGRSEYWL